MNVSRAAGIVWRDFTLLLVLGFVAMVLILLPFVQPPGKEDDGAPPPGNVIVQVFWPEGNIDVDTWIMGPGETRPVGYSNKSGKLFNLLRDDLGNPDPARNFENAYSRGTPTGEYIVNVHCYRCPVVPITVEVEVSINDAKPGKASLRKLVSTRVELTRNGHERTVVRFLLDDDAKLVPNSVNQVQRELRAMRNSAGADYGGGL